MTRILSAALCALLSLPVVAQAQDRIRLGYGRLVVNDVFGDGRDRWRSGSVISSRVWGSEWTGQAPEKFGDILELRLGAEIIQPDNIVTPAPGDRPYAGAVSVGVHTHMQRGGTEVALGADMVITGPQTGLDGLQGGFHDLLGVGRASGAVLNGQVKNGFYPTAVLELGRSIDIGQRSHLRPFVEGRAGAETLVRAGIDVTFGNAGRGELLVRDPVSGQRYRTMTHSGNGYSFVMGGDIAKVSSSAFLPSTTHTLSDTRQRLRAGVHWQGKKGSGFYGLSWLGDEFVGQGGGQVVGSLRLNFDF
jgi:hypothetical protein